MILSCINKTNIYLIRKCLKWLFLRLYHCFSCRDSNPLRDIFTVQHPGRVTKVTTTDLKASNLGEEKLEWTNGEVTLIYSEDAGTQIIQHQDSVTDYCSLSSNSSLEPLGSDCVRTAGLGSLAGHSSVALLADQNEIGRDWVLGQDQYTSTSPESDLGSVEIVNPTTPQLQAMTVLPVNGTLWIPRYKKLYTQPKTT